MTPDRLLLLHANLRKEALTRPKVSLVFLGDSITEGYRGTDFGAPCPRNRCAGIPAVVKEHFGPGTRWPCRLALGLAADETQHLLWRLQHGGLGTVAPAVAVLLIGTNNFGIGRMTDLEVTQGIAAIVELLLQLLPNTQVVLMTLLPRELHGRFTAPIARTNRRLRAICDARLHPRLRCAHCGPAHCPAIHKGAVAVFLTPDGRVNRTLMPDLLHPSAAGVAKMFRDCLRPIVRFAAAAAAAGTQSTPPAATPHPA
jgi:lysophospholipase L1-like esterase